MAANLKQTFADLFGMDEKEEIIEQENVIPENEYDKKSFKESKELEREKKSEGKVIKMRREEEMNLVIFKPKSFEETSDIADKLKDSKPVVVNLEDLDNEVARKCFDFFSGAVYALNGSMQKVSKNIFVLAPHNVDLKNIDSRNHNKFKSALKLKR